MERERKVRCTLKEAVDGNMVDPIVREIRESVYRQLDIEIENMLNPPKESPSGVFIGDLLIATTSKELANKWSGYCIYCKVYNLHSSYCQSNFCPVCGELYIK